MWGKVIASLTGAKPSLESRRDNVMRKSVAGEDGHGLDQILPQRFSILIVDDDTVVGDALKVVLESNGYEVVWVDNGRAGIIEANRRRFALGIIDLFLSDISGLQAIRNIKTTQPEFPIILITGNGTPEAFAAARRLGVLGILEKPFRPEDILELISRAIQK